MGGGTGGRGRRAWGGLGGASGGGPSLGPVDLDTARVGAGGAARMAIWTVWEVWTGNKKLSWDGLCTHGAVGGTGGEAKERRRWLPRAHHARATRLDLAGGVAARRPLICEPVAGRRRLRQQLYCLADPPPFRADGASSSSSSAPPTTLKHHVHLCLLSHDKHNTYDGLRRCHLADAEGSQRSPPVRPAGSVRRFCG